MRAFACAWAVLLAASAWAQVELVDPDAPSVRAKKVVPKPLPEDLSNDETPAADEGDAEAADSDPADTEPEPAPVKKRAVAAPAQQAAEAVLAPQEAPREAKKEPTKEASKPPPPALVVTQTSDAQVDEVWAMWREASTFSDTKREQEARQSLLKLKRRIGATNLEAWASGLLRAAAARQTAGDSGAAIEMALTAVELAPDLPAAWAGLAEAYFQSDPTEIGRYLGALKNAVVLRLRDPRYARPMMADVGTTLLLAFIGTALTVLLVLLLKHGRYFLYDFHFLFPRAAARWQTTALGVILLSVPLVFHFGIVPSSLAFFAAVTLYLSTVERVVAAVLISCLGLVPLAGGWLTHATTFAGTSAESLYLIERGGSGTEALATELATLAAEDKASFAQLSVLGRYELRRGRLESAIEHLKKALTVEPSDATARANDASARVNLGVALMLTGDLENPKALFASARAQAPQLAAAPYNLGRLYQRRVATLGERAAVEADNATGEFYEARRRDPNLAIETDREVTRGDAPIEASDYLLTAPLADAELLDLAKLPDAPKRVTSQLSQLLLGDAPEGFAFFYPGLMAALIVAMGALAVPLAAARSCGKCGRPVSHRGDPDVARGSSMCTQCINVFAKKNVVATSQKVRKQLEIARYQSRIDRTSSVLGLLFSGMGHVYSGSPVRGTIYGFLFLVALLGFVVRHGLLRAPYEPLPMIVRLMPLTILFVAVYLVSLRQLRKRLG